MTRHTIECLLERCGGSSPVRLTQPSRTNRIPGIGATLARVEMAGRLARQLARKRLASGGLVPRVEPHETAQQVDADCGEAPIVRSGVLTS